MAGGIGAAPGRAGFDSRYLVVACAFAVQGLVIGSLFAYGVLFKSLEIEFGWSRTLLSASTSIAFFMMGVLVFFVGRLTDRVGPRRVLTFTGVAYGIGLVLLGSISEPWQLVALFAVFIGLGLSTHDVVTLSTVARWFDRRRGIMTGVVKVGTATGQMVIPVLLGVAIAAFGWRTACVLLGIVVGVLLVLAAQGMRWPSRDAGGPSAAEQPAASSLTLRDAARTRAFRTLCLVQFCFMPSLVTIPLHMPVHGMDLGLDTATAASLLAAIGGASAIGRLLVGATADRLGGKIALSLCFVLLAAGVFWLLFANSGAMLFGVCIVYGIGHGGLFTVVSPTVAEYFGTSAHGAIFGAILFFGTIGASAGPILAGRAFDVLGSYDPAFATLGVMALIGLALVLSLPRPKR